MLRRFTKRIIIALLIVTAITIVAVVVSIASWLTGTGKQASSRAAARMQEGGEFGKTTNQQVCIDEGLKRGAKLGLLDLTARATTKISCSAVYNQARPVPDL